MELDSAVNAVNGPRISKTQSRVSTWVILTNEELFGFVGLSLVADSLSAFLFARVTVIRDENGADCRTCGPSVTHRVRVAPRVLGFEPKSVRKVE